MILTVTPNPSLDRTLHIERFVRGDVVRASGTALDPSGKGVNVSLALAANGIRTRAVLPAGGFVGGHLVALLRAAGLDFVVVPVAGDVRSNTSVVERDGTVTKLNEPGPRLAAGEVDRLLDAVRLGSRSVTCVVGCGSLPEGVPADLYARIVLLARESGVSSVLDSSGEALVAGLAAGPDLVKPNVDELAAATGLPVGSLAQAMAAAMAMQRSGANAVLVSLGPDGALLVGRDVALHGEAVVPVVRNTVGAGDAMLAGFLAGGGSRPDDEPAKALAEALAWGAAACGIPDSRMPGPADIDRSVVTIHPELTDRPLSHPAG